MKEWGKQRKYQGTIGEWKVERKGKRRGREKSIWYTPGMRHNEAKEWDEAGTSTQTH